MISLRKQQSWKTEIPPHECMSVTAFIFHFGPTHSEQEANESL